MSMWSKLTSSSTSSNKWATSLKSLHNANEGNDASPTFITLRILNESYERTIYIYIFVVSHGSLLKISSTYTTLHISFANSARGRLFGVFERCNSCWVYVQSLPRRPSAMILSFRNCDSLCWTESLPPKPIDLATGFLLSRESKTW